MTDTDELARLRTRLERERRARRQAEVIAERGMRELWEANRELQARVARRTAELERLVDGLEYAHAARLRAIAELADDVADHVGGPGGPDAEHLRRAAQGIDEIHVLAESVLHVEDVAEVECRPTEIGDQLIERWQRPAARRGQLLTVEVGSSPAPARFRWAQVMAIADVVVGGFVRHGGTGSLSVMLTVGDDVVDLEVRGSGDGQIDSGEAVARSAVDADLALAARMVRSCGGSLHVGRTVDRSFAVAASLPGDVTRP